MISTLVWYGFDGCFRDGCGPYGRLELRERSRDRMMFCEKNLSTDARQGADIKGRGAVWSLALLAKIMAFISDGEDSFSVSRKSSFNATPF